MAKPAPEFNQRNGKVIGLNIDPVENHLKWGKDIAYLQINYSMSFT